MSRAPFLSTTMRSGRKMGDVALIDALNGALTDPFGGVLMGVTAENVAKRYGIGREMQDALALTSQQRAARQWRRAISDPYVPVEVKARGRTVAFNLTNMFAPVRRRRISPGSSQFFAGKMAP